LVSDIDLRLFENRVLRRIFGLKWNKMVGARRKLHNKELHNLYSSPTIIIMIKSGRQRIYHARRRREMHIGFCCESQKEDQDIDGWIIVQWILEK
jgi:hypothetical protein